MYLCVLIEHADRAWCLGGVQLSERGDFSVFLRYVGWARNVEFLELLSQFLVCSLQLLQGLIKLL